MSGHVLPRVVLLELLRPLEQLGELAGLELVALVEETEAFCSRSISRLPRQRCSKKD